MKTDKAGSDQFLRIIRWNKLRNNLELNLDLEAKMLSEELSEFFHADTLVDRLDAYCDFHFVAQGTVAKTLGFNSKTGFDTLMQVQSQAEELLMYVGVAKNVMLDILKEELSQYNKAYAYDDTILDELITEAIEIVLLANEAKPTEKNIEGKVIKGVDFKRPEEKLKALILRRCVNYGNSNK